MYAMYVLITQVFVYICIHSMIAKDCLGLALQIKSFS